MQAGKNELIGDIFQWAFKHGHMSVSGPAKIYIHLLWTLDVFLRIFLVW